MSEKIRVINNRDRYYNWAYKWNILEIDKNSLEEYLNAWFSLVSEVIPKNGIVNKKDTEEDNRTVEELKAILDHHWVEYKAKAKKTELLELVKDLEKKSDNSEKEEKTDLEKIKEQILAENIENKENLAKMSDSEIMELASNNGLI